MNALVSVGLGPSTRGYVPTYYTNETNRCPGCGRSQWIVGRLLAECAFCTTALPLDTSLCGSGSSRPVIQRRDHLAT